MFRRIEFKILLSAILLVLLLQAIVIAGRRWGVDIRLASPLLVLGGAWLRRGLNNHALDAEVAALPAPAARTYRGANAAVRLILLAAIVATGWLMLQEPPAGWRMGGLDPFVAVFAAVDAALVGATALCLHAARMTA